MDNIAPLLGLALRAGRLAVGEESVRTASRNHKAYLLLLASDAADNTIRRARQFTQAGTNTICLQIPMTKEELGGCLGRASCAMLAVTDIGFASALADRLAVFDPDAYGAARDALRPRAQRAARRRKETGRAANGKRGQRGTDPRKKSSAENSDRKRRS